MKVVVDTNIFVSGLINTDGTPAQIVNLVINGRSTLIYDDRILKEYADVLNRKKFGFKRSMIDPLLDFIRNLSEYVGADPINKAFTDEDDKKFYEVAKTGAATCIVTGNKNHYPKEAIVKSPSEFIQLYLAENQGKSTEAT
ncbi:MAG: putative toxin-antitoxin system toxin component, PIN family [Spirochaetia bacterium]|jgi:putative PIN family toxin of toxin-antitoxin system